ncbi:hypothetical protein EAH89_28530 [Roseomonas nepalensis]|uniref:Uncharacterized protein n=1 Tax=Muricoccus nepalensis TaxID=1854500 RepID=A0A502EVV5_9PROT|nr:hypothetical protein EAH89_28530 [Roseomonas nepalensis]
MRHWQGGDGADDRRELTQRAHDATEHEPANRPTTTTTSNPASSASRTIRLKALSALAKDTPTKSMPTGCRCASLIGSWMVRLEAPTISALLRQKACGLVVPRQTT